MSSAIKAQSAFNRIIEGSEIASMIAAKAATERIWRVIRSVESERYNHFPAWVSAIFWGRAFDVTGKHIMVPPTPAI